MTAMNPVREAPLLLPTAIDLPVSLRQNAGQVLQAVLANLFDLYSQVKLAHWNVKGPHFKLHHELFDELAAELPEQIDDVAERMKALGLVVSGSIRQSARLSTLEDLPAEMSQGRDLIEALKNRYAQVAQQARQGIEQTAEDADTADLLTGLSRLLDKRLWMLEAHLQ